MMHAHLRRIGVSRGTLSNEFYTGILTMVDKSPHSARLGRDSTMKRTRHTPEQIMCKL
jgi:hypothetical protein